MSFCDVTEHTAHLSLALIIGTCSLLTRQMPLAVLHFLSPSLKRDKSNSGRGRKSNLGDYYYCCY